ncbi:MAG: glucose 1-dehydrogenase [Acidobacteria bacterium]|nr:glucose 1-dehydrogenase [Acidobacteriota bacterium]
MKAIVVRPGVTDSIHMRDMPDPRMGDDQVAVRMLRVGLCGTDAEINHGRYGQPPTGEEFLILGHENLGVVLDVGRNVKTFTPGEIVVSTVRRPCGQCPNCDAGENDCCSSGNYEERGIMRRHGFMAEYYVEHPQYLTRLPAAVEPFAVLLEPMSVVEKGIDHAFLLQRRLVWNAKLALVLGAGPVGLLGAAALRARGLRTVVVGREPAGDLRARIATQLGAEYVSVENGSVLDLPREIGRPDLVLEATGSARVVFDAMQILGPNGVLCLLSVTGGTGTNEEPIDRINRQLVLGNQAVFGSVNANSRHFAKGVEDFVRIEEMAPGAMSRLLTNAIPWQDFKTWFTRRGSGIKSTLEIG